MHGCGERWGNTNLCSIIPVLEVKLGRETIGRERLGMLTSVSHYVAERANLPHRSDLPFVGRSAFAHKGGIHVSAVMRDPATYEHVDPELTGNSRRVLVSDLSGKSNILYKTAELGIGGAEEDMQGLVTRIKELEHQGFQFEAAEGSLRVLMEKALGNYRSPFALDSYHVSVERSSDGTQNCDATLTVEL